MKDCNLEWLVVHISGNPLIIQPTTELRNDIQKAKKKYSSIKKINGKPVKIIGLTMKVETLMKPYGLTHETKQIELTYEFNGKQYEKVYSKEQFYDL